MMPDAIREAAPVAGVRIWWIDLDRDLGLDAEDWCSVQEHMILSTLTVPLVRLRRARGFAATRWILGHLAGLAPPDVPIDRQRGEKPVLGQAMGNWQYSFSHSQGLACLAAARGHAVGVDVEWDDPAIPIMELMGGHNSNYTVENREDAWRSWVTHEAIFKCNQVFTSRPCDGTLIYNLNAMANYPAILAVGSFQTPD